YAIVPLDEGTVPSDHPSAKSSIDCTSGDALNVNTTGFTTSLPSGGLPIATHGPVSTTWTAIACSPRTLPSADMPWSTTMCLPTPAVTSITDSETATCSSSCPS